MTTQARVYVVTDSTLKTKTLVRANNPAQAIRHAVSSRFSAAPVKVDELVELLGTNVTVENATLTLEAVNTAAEA